MNFRALLSGISVLSFLFVAPISNAKDCGSESPRCSAGFNNQSIKGCYAFSLYGNFLGPEVTAGGEQTEHSSDTVKLVSYGYSTVGRQCFDGAGHVREISGTANFAGLCADTYSGTGEYEVRKDGTGTGLNQITIDTVTDGCARLGIEPGVNQVFSYSAVLQSKRDCIKVIFTGAATVDVGGGLIPQPIVAEGEACRQVGPR
jgi:hypothetical protein